MEFRKYQRKGLSEMTTHEEYIKEHKNLNGVSISDEDKKLAKEIFEKGYIARNPNNHKDMWYVAEKYHAENLELYEDAKSEKSLDVTSIADAKNKVSDIKVFGDGDTWRLICKASSESQGWMKSTKAMETGNGCVIQVTTQQKNQDGSCSIAENICFVPNVGIFYDEENNNTPFIDILQKN